MRYSQIGLGIKRGCQHYKDDVSHSILSEMQSVALRMRCRAETHTCSCPAAHRGPTDSILCSSFWDLSVSQFMEKVNREIFVN